MFGTYPGRLNWEHGFQVKHIWTAIPSQSRSFSCENCGKVKERIKKKTSSIFITSDFVSPKVDSKQLSSATTWDQHLVLYRHRGQESLASGVSGEKWKLMIEKDQEYKLTYRVTSTHDSDHQPMTVTINPWQVTLTDAAFAKTSKASFQCCRLAWINVLTVTGSQRWRIVATQRER